MNFQQWAQAVAPEVATARGYSVEDVATEPGEIAAQLSRARKYAVIMGELKTEAKSWVLKSRAVAIENTRNRKPDFNSDERKSISDADPDYLAALKIHGHISSTHEALKSMHFEILNDRRTSKF